MKTSLGAFLFVIYSAATANALSAYVPKAQYDSLNSLYLETKGQLKTCQDNLSNYMEAAKSCQTNLTRTTSSLKAANATVESLKISVSSLEKTNGSLTQENSLLVTNNKQLSLDVRSLKGEVSSCQSSLNISQMEAKDLKIQNENLVAEIIGLKAKLNNCGDIRIPELSPVPPEERIQAAAVSKITTAIVCAPPAGTQLYFSDIGLEVKNAYLRFEFTEVSGKVEGVQLQYFDSATGTPRAAPGKSIIALDAKGAKTSGVMYTEVKACFYRHALVPNMYKYLDSAVKAYSIN